MFFYDFQIFFWVRDFDNWLIANGYPSFHQTFPQFKQFFNSEFFCYFRRLIGYNNCFAFPPELANASFGGYDFEKLDKLNYHGLHGLSNYQIACKMRQDCMQFILPSITDTIKFQNDPNLYNTVYAPPKSLIPKYPYRSMEDFS
jgi:hypothetical protein